MDNKFIITTSYKKLKIDESLNVIYRIFKKGCKMKKSVVTKVAIFRADFISDQVIQTAELYSEMSIEKITESNV